MGKKKSAIVKSGETRMLIDRKLYKLIYSYIRKRKLSKINTISLAISRLQLSVDKFPSALYSHLEGFIL